MSRPAVKARAPSAVAALAPSASSWIRTSSSPGKCGPNRARAARSSGRPRLRNSDAPSRGATLREGAGGGAPRSAWSAMRSAPPSSGARARATGRRWSSWLLNPCSAPSASPPPARAGLAPVLPVRRPGALCGEVIGIAVRSLPGPTFVRPGRNPVNRVETAPAPRHIGAMARLGSWLKPFPEGIYVKPADAWIDPSRPKAKALVTHGHADHARGGHERVWATPETLAIMDCRYGPQAGVPVAYGEVVRMGEVDVSFVPAGHVLGSAQIVLEHAGERIVVSGDYKRRPDPTCAPFEPVPCDIFVTEATFGLPVFRHPATAGEVDRLLQRLHDNPERCILVGAYALGK